MQKKFNPFRAFQRNKTGWMAGITLLAIVSFLFLPVILELVGGGRYDGHGHIKTIADSRRFGSINEFDIQRLQEENEALLRFLEVLHRNLLLPPPENLNLLDASDEEQMKVFQEHWTKAQERAMALRPLQMFTNEVFQLQQPEQLVNAWLVTKYVQQEGYSPNWDDVRDRLKQLTDGYLSDTIYDDTLRTVGISHKMVEQLLIRQLLWERAQQRFILSVSAVSPANRWDWFQRINRQVTIEAAAVPVDSLISQIAEPSDRVLNAFFEANKTRKHDPALADVGFIMPVELAFQYVVATPSPMLLDSITEEEMLAYYEANKDTEFRRPPTPMPELPTLPGMPSGATPFPAPTFPGMPAPGIPERDVTPTLPDIEDLPPAEEPAPSEPTPSEPMPPESEETTAGMKRSVMTDEVKPPSLRYRSIPAFVEQTVTTKLVSYQTEEEVQEPEGVSSPVTPAEDIVADAAPETPVDLSILFRPFDEVKDQIRMTLARQKARESLPIIQEKMREYSNTYHDHFERNMPAPLMPDLTALVAEQGLTLVTVPRGDVYAALQTDFARGFEERRQLVRMFRTIPLLFEAATFETLDGLVLYWITDEQPELRPAKIDEVKDIVLKRWKEVEARSLAQKKAEELADEVRASGKPLAEAFSGRNDLAVVETEPFVWRVQTDFRSLPELGEVLEAGVAEGFSHLDNKIIHLPGSDFMETVYSLQVGETGVAFNQPQTVAYVVRLTNSSPSEDSLWMQFQTAPVWQYLGAGQPEMVGTAFEAWLDDIRAKTGFRWINKPEPIELRDEGW